MDDPGYISLFAAINSLLHEGTHDWLLHPEWIDVFVALTPAEMVALYGPGGGPFVPYIGATANVDLGLHSLTVDSPTLFVDAVNHRVGMGTITPPQPVTIDLGLVRLRQTGSTRYRSDWNVSNAQTILNSFDDIGGVYLPLIFSGLTYAIRPSGDSTKGFFQNSSGSIGINTVSPNGPLEVSDVGATLLYVTGTGVSGQAIIILNTPDVAGTHAWDFRSAGATFLIRDETVGQYRLAIDTSGRIGIGGTTAGLTGPTANLHLGAGTATANTAPLKINSGTLLTSPEAGAIEFLTDAFYGTQTTGPTRKQFAMVDAASIGAAGEMAAINTTGLTANVSASTLYAAPSTGEGFYRVSAYVVETTAGSLSSTLPNVQIVYTDKDSNTSVTMDATPILAGAGLGQSAALGVNAVGTVSSGVIVIYVKASTTIQYQTVNYASNLAGMTYALRLRLELL